MKSRCRHILIWTAGFACAALGGCECGRDVGARSAAEIDKKPISDENPHAPQPGTYFPDEVKTSDASLNSFIDRMLRICREGDYDAFRQLFSTAYAPPSPEDFERIWHMVRDIRVEGVLQKPTDPPEYFVYGHVYFRQPDRKGREERPVVVRVFEEADEWRLGTASEEVVRKILAIQSQPAPDQPESESPAS